jgi:DNA-binding IclR family transcriptional regulator
MGQAPAAEQALAVLQVLARHATPLPAMSVARETGIPRSSLYRVLDVLVEQGFVSHLRDQHRYGLGVASFELGSAYTRQQPLRWIARGSLERLVASTREHAHFATLHGRDVLYLIEERAPARAPLVTEVGIRLPAHLTASGLAILAAMPARQVAAIFPSRSAFTRRDGGGPSSPAELRAALTKARALRYAEENGWVTPGFASVASAVLDHRDHPVGAVAITFQASQLDAARREDLAEQARAAAAEISRATRPPSAD